MSDVKIENLKGLEVDIKYDDIVEEYSDKCADACKVNSPRGYRTNKPYREGWEAKEKVNKAQEKSYVVWNKTNYQLTHLLEKGHATKKGGRVNGTHFIEKASDEVISAYTQWIEEVLNG